VIINRQGRRRGKRGGDPAAERKLALPTGVEPYDRQVARVKSIEPAFLEEAPKAHDRSRGGDGAARRKIEQCDAAFRVNQQVVGREAVRRRVDAHIGKDCPIGAELQQRRLKQRLTTGACLERPCIQSR
jgi:hypothetical protein